MTRIRSRFSGVTLLATAVLVLLPALAWLQYSWLDQIADADRERRARTLQMAASQLAQDLDAELAKAVFDLQIEPAMVEQRAWSSFAERQRLWTEQALVPEMIKGIYLVEVSPGGMHRGDPPLQLWDAQARMFVAVEWPRALAAIRTRFLHESRTIIDLQIGSERRGERRETSAMQRVMLPAGDEQAIVVPIMRLTAAAEGATATPPPPDLRLLGFSILRFDLAAIGDELLPLLVRRHLNADEGGDFLVAVVSRQDTSQVIFESAAGVSTIATANPDVTVPLLGPRIGPLMFMARDIRRGGRIESKPPPPPPAPPPGGEDRVVVGMVESRRVGAGPSHQTRLFAGEGHWQLVAKHRSGSLEAAVTSARTRNFVLSSGILLLLTTAIGLIVVSARRADRLARQQLEFVATVSHELRTPVSVINAAAGNLADGVVEEPARVKKYGVTIQAESRRLAETVERVLQLAGIAAGRAAASPALIPGQRLIAEALAALRHEIESAAIRLELDVPGDLPSVRGDALALRSALQNLIGNAVKYAGETRWVGVSAHAESSTLRIAVADRGLGISAEDRKHIFEPFYRGREAVSRQIQGSGLGLHLVARIIGAHGGRVSVSSEPGQGSTFTIELPVATEPPEPSTAHQHTPMAAEL